MAESTKTEFKDTLNLPQTTLPMRANATVRELEIQKFWVENNIYEKMIGERDKTNSFVLHDGPPYLSSEKIHVGTALNKILKDILIKYKSQRGFYAPYVPGMDYLLKMRLLKHLKVDVTLFQKLNYVQNVENLLIKI